MSRVPARVSADGDRADRKPIPLAALRDPVILLATGFGAGLLRPAPGTWGTLAALPLIWLLVTLPPAIAWGIVAVIAVGGIPLCTRAGERLGVADHGGIVIDEIAGFALTVMLLPHDLLTVVAAFVAFRVFDIAKPWPVSWADRRLGGGFGVMLDDLLAALYAAASVWLLLALIGYAHSVS